MRCTVLSALLLLCTVCSTRAQWTERAPLLSDLRPSARAELTASELAGFAHLPLYDLSLVLADDLKSYRLQESIEVENDASAPLPEIALRLFGNRGPVPTALDVRSVRCLERACRSTQPRPDLLILQLTEALPAGARMRITLELSGRLPEIAPGRTDPVRQGLESLASLATGEPSNDYGLLSYGDEIATLAHFYAVLARRNGTRWITAEQKPFGDVGAGGLSFVRASLRVPRDVTLAVSGVRVEDTSARDDGKTRLWRVRAPLVRDFGLGASRRWSEHTRRVGDVSVRSYALLRDADGGERALDTAAAALASYERRFGAYPYRELAIAEGALLGGAGGCELSGLALVASMLYRPLPLGASLLELTTAHEVAHQYWYGLVGSDAREHPVEDESLTQWSALYYFEDRFGSERATREGDAQVALSYRMLRWLGGADAVADRPVDSFDSALSYAGLVYGKAPYLYAALRKHLGDAVFFGALHEYVRRYRFRDAPPSALFDVLSEQSGRPREVRRLVQHWLAERHGDHDLGVAPNAWLSAAMSGAPASAAPSGTRSSPTQQPSAADAPAPAQLEQLQQLLAGQAGPGAVSAEQLSGALQGLLGNGAGGQLDVHAIEQLLQGQGGAELPQLEPNERGLGERP